MTTSNCAALRRSRRSLVAWFINVTAQRSLITTWAVVENEMIYSFSGSLISSNSFLHLPPNNNNNRNNMVSAVTAARFGASVTDCGVVKGSQHPFMHMLHTYTHAFMPLSRLVCTAVAIKCPMTSHQRFNSSSSAATHWFVASAYWESAGVQPQNERKNFTKNLYEICYFIFPANRDQVEDFVNFPTTTN